LIDGTHGSRDLDKRYNTEMNLLCPSFKIIGEAYASLEVYQSVAPTQLRLTRSSPEAVTRCNSRIPIPNFNGRYDLRESPQTRCSRWRVSQQVRSFQSKLEAHMAYPCPGPIIREWWVKASTIDRPLREFARGYTGNERSTRVAGPAIFGHFRVKFLPFLNRRENDG